MSQVFAVLPVRHMGGHASGGPTSRRHAGKVTAMMGASLLALGLFATPQAVLAQRGETPNVQSQMARAPLTFADIVERVKPAVVSISVTGGGRAARNPKAGPGAPGAPGREGSPLPDLPDDHPLNDFFKNMPKEFRGQPTPRPTQAQGSGFVISTDGYVVTNNHVIDGASKIQVTFDNQDKVDADLVGTDPRTDLALLKLKGERTYKHVKFASNPGRVGDWVVAVGNPFFQVSKF